MRRSWIAATGLLIVLSTPLAAQAQSGPLSAIFNCSATGQKQETGALIGGALGGVLGNKLSKDDKTLGTALGVALGAAAGSYVGCRMQVSDQAKAEAAARTALETGSSQSWNNSATGATGSTVVYPVNNSGSSMAGIRLSGNLTPVSLSSGSGLYYAPSVANVRAAPSTSGAIISRLSARQQVEVLARVTGQPWVLIGQNGTGTGYVASSVLRPVSATPAPAAPTMTQASNGCRIIEQTYTPPGQAATVERYNACKDASGQWQLSRI